MDSELSKRNATSRPNTSAPSPEPAAVGRSSTPGASPTPAASVTDVLDEKTQRHRENLAASLVLADLKEDDLGDFVELKIQDPNAYLFSVAPSDLAAAVVDPTTLSRFFKSLEMWKQDGKHLSSSLNTMLAAVEPTSFPILERLSREANAAFRASDLQSHDATALKIYSTNQQPDVVVPEALKGDLKRMSAVLSELLRHFWSCFSDLPRSTDKLKRLNDALNLFSKELQVSRQPALRKGVVCLYCPACSSQAYRMRMNETNQSRYVGMVKPLEVMLSKASDQYEKFAGRLSRTAAAPVHVKRPVTVDLTSDSDALSSKKSKIA